MGREPGAPLSGLRVVEATSGLSVVGAGMATSLPGALFRDFGAEVTRVQPRHPFSLDAGVEWARSWDHGKEVHAVEPDRLDGAIAGLAEEADVVFLSGSEEAIERRGLTYQDLNRRNPRLVVVRTRPSYDATGAMPDLELLVAARCGLLAQVAGHRPGPVFPAVNVASAGAALTATAGALAALYEREATGAGGWVETSLYDGMLALLPMIAGRAEHPSPTITSLWATLGPALALSFRCADGDYVQLWFGAKGAYEAFLEHIGDEPSEAGYQADTMSGAIGERSRRWAETFATRDRDWWVERLAGQAFRCEPVLRAGEELRDPHLRHVGLAVDLDDPDRGPITVIGPAGNVTPVPACGGGPAHPETGSRFPGPAYADPPIPPPSSPDPETGPRLLSGVRVLDLSAYLAGPVTPLVLAELGADVVKVEPTAGDAHRGVEPMFAAGQRGKRAMALDLKAPESAGVLARLFSWADVVHHNARLGLAERLGYDEATVREANPDVVYSHASGFGSEGPRASLAANDHLMQALSGLEAAAGGDGQPPTWVNWGAIDVTSGWVSACAVLAGLYARRRTGVPQSVATSLLGAALILKSGPFLAAGGTLVEGPTTDAGQTGYGAAYRIYRGADGAWLALAVPDARAWARLLEVVGHEGLPDEPPPLRQRRGERQPAETRLEGVFSTRDAAEWVGVLQAAGVPAELVTELDRAAFNARLFDDPVNRMLGRVASFAWGERGRLDQPWLPVRFGPAPRPVAPARIPALGEHTGEVLDGLGFTREEREKLAAGGVVAGGRA